MGGLGELHPNHQTPQFSLMVIAIVIKLSTQVPWISEKVDMRLERPKGVGEGGWVNFTQVML